MKTRTDLKVLNGTIIKNRFLLCSIAGVKVNGYYRSSGLRSIARLIEGKDPVTIIIDRKKRIRIPEEMKEHLIIELNLIADKLEH